jgi:hypothetical protein
MVKIVSFGDSFILGDELSEIPDGTLTWPGLIAERLGTDYETRAVSGCGNDHIARQIYTYFAHHDPADTLCVINWTWISRWDYFLKARFAEPIDPKNIASVITQSRWDAMAGSSWPTWSEYLEYVSLTDQPHPHPEVTKYTSSLEIHHPGKWITLGPTCAPEKLSWMNNHTEAQRVVSFYKDHGEHSLLWNKARNLQTIYAAQSYLKHISAVSIQTHMDPDLFDRTHADLNPDYVRVLQDLVSPNLQWFHNEMNFIDWAKSQGYEVTPPPGDHPLSEAHEAAADLWINRYQSLLFP